MKASRLLAYGVIGIIGGLLIENRTLIFREDAKENIYKLKKKIRKAVASK